MIAHNCIGHPIAAALTLVGASRLARKVHYATLPASSRARWAFGEIEYTADRRLFLVDFVCAPLTAALQAAGLHKAAWLYRRLFETPLVQMTGACGGWDYSQAPPWEESRSEAREDPPEESDDPSRPPSPYHIAMTQDRGPDGIVTRYISPTTLEEYEAQGWTRLHSPDAE